MKTTIYAAVVTYPDGHQCIGTVGNSDHGPKGFCESWNELNQKRAGGSTAHVERFEVDLKPKRKASAA